MPSFPGYQIERLVSEGRATRTYRGVRTGNRKQVLLKTTKTEYPSLLDVQRLRREYETLRSLSFDGHVVPVALERHHHRTVLVLDDPGWRFLADMLLDGPLDVRRFLDVAIRVADVVAGMHRSNVIHLDIRPSNILIDEHQGDVRLAGFGLATHTSHLARSSSNAPLPDGPLAYVAPEQTGRTHRAVDHRTDLYALGVTFYEMLTGSPPFVHDDPAHLVHALVALQPQPLSKAVPDVPRVLSDVVMKLLAKDLENRYQSAHGLKSDLETCARRMGAKGTIDDFPLGERDGAERFVIPEILYGRKDETSALFRAFDRACAGASEIVVVTGAAGSGKTTLIEQLRSRAAERKAYFVEGKFDKMLRNVPYSALVHVCRDLIRQILIESDSSVAIWGDRIRTAVGPIAQVIVDVVPELALIVGRESPLPPLAPAEAQNRFNLAWQKFLNVFARENVSLVMFFDDLQWADSASLSLIENRMADADNRHLLLIGAYRDGDVGSSHPVRLSVKMLQDAGRSVSRITLHPLGKDEIAALLADTLRLPVEDLSDLSELLHVKTLGNPLSIIETLQLLHRKALIRFDLERGAWTWDLEAIRAAELSKNIVDLLIDRMHTLAPRTRSALMLAAGIGNTFDAATLSAVRDGMSDVVVDLADALEQGLIQFSSEVDMNLSDVRGVEDPETAGVSFRFLHDRVRQAAYAQIDEKDRAAIHLRIGRVLRDGRDAAALENRLFGVVNHLNLGAELIDEPEVRVDLARLNYEACRKAKAASAFELALGFARTGLDLLDESMWEHQYELMRGLHFERAESEYLVGHVDSANALCEALLERVRSDADRVDLHNLRITLYTSQSKYEEAVREGIKAARLLDLKLPDEPGQTHIIQEFLRAKWNLRGMKADDLMNLPSMVDARQIATVNLLMNLTAPAFLSSEIFAILISLKLFNISLRHGLSKATPYGFMVYAVVNAGLGKIERAREFGEMALELREKLPHVEKGHILPFLFATAVNHWTAPAATNIEHLLHSYRASLDAGDLLYADYALITIVVNAFYKGDELDTVLEHCDRYLDFFTRHRGTADDVTAQRQAEKIQRQHIRCLKGSTNGITSLSDDGFDEQVFLGGTLAPLVLLEYYTKKLQLLVLFDVSDELPELLRRSAPVIRDVEITGDVRVSDYVFYKALALTSLPATRSRRRALKAARMRLKRWAASSPANFRHRHLLVEADAARAAGDDRRAMDLFDEAIAAAETFDSTPVQALAGERAARFYAAIGKERIAGAYLAGARHGYALWGATAKVGELDERFGHLLPATGENGDATDGSLEQVDLASFTKASLALSEEIMLDRLLERMSGIVIENAGAERGVLVLEVDGRLVVEAEVSVGSNVRLTSSQPLEETTLLPVSVALYVVRTKEPVVLDNASDEGIFAGDPYIVQHHARSVLCLPLVHQGRLTGALYLENNLATGIFTRDNLQLVTLLSAQLSVSIENARLYRNLEEKVAERTEELSRKNEDLESAMQHLKDAQSQLIQAEKLASLGQLTAGIAHEIKNPLNFINNFAGLTHELIEELEEEMKDDPELRLADVKDLISDLKVNVAKIEDHGRRSDGIVRNMLEHSRATRGERAPTDLNALLREYVGLSYHAMRAQHPEFNATIEWDLDERECRYDVVPQEVGRVFLNLLNNAFYAVNDRDESDDRTPTIRCVSIFDDDGVEIRIEDNGRGISEEHRAKIFEPFFTTKPTGEGTGLGLSLSYEIISMGYGGRLSAERSALDGAAFVIRLPRAAGE